MTATRWDPFKRVVVELGVHRVTLARWCDEGWVTSKREGPKLRFVLVYAEGPAAGRPVGLNDNLPAQESATT